MTETTYPYPLRQSELIKALNFEAVPEISLSGEERSRLVFFERPFFERLKSLRDIDVTDHVIYPEAFTSEKGKKLFAATYLDPLLKEKIKNTAQTAGLDWENSKQRKTACEQFFDDLESRVEEEELRPRLGEVNGKDIELIIREADLSRIPKRIRERLNTWSAKWAEQAFKEEFIESGGNLENVSNPLRITKIVNPEDLRKKERGLRNLKADVKRAKSSIGTDEGDLGKAKKQLCDLYLRYVNVLIARLYPYRRIDVAGGDGGKQTQLSRSVERIDHFLNGVGLRLGEDGLLQTIPDDLAAYANNRLQEMGLLPEEEEYKKYNSYKLSAVQAKTIADEILNSYGFSAEGWRAVILERLQGLGVAYDLEQNTREVRIPRDFDRGLMATLGLLAHEIEGHVLRFANKEAALAGELMIVQEMSTGRSSVLSEGASMWVQDISKREMFGTKVALPYYWVGLSEKARGGSFKECFYASLQARARAKHNMSVRELVLDKEKFDDEFDKTYTSVLRLFRRFTPLDDKTGYITISDTLDYLEQERVVEFLLSHGEHGVLSKLLFVAGIDLYSLDKLIGMGFLDLSKVKQPEFFVAKKLWPKIKSRLDQGQALDDAIS